MMALCPILILTSLGILSVYDIIFNEVPLVIVIAALCIALVNITIEGEVNYQIIAIIPGIILLTIGVVFPKKVGTGDGLVLILSEMMIPNQYVLFQLELLAIFSIVSAIILLIIKKKILPLIPIITISHTIVLWVSRAGGLFGC